MFIGGLESGVLDFLLLLVNDLKKFIDLLFTICNLIFALIYHFQMLISNADYLLHLLGADQGVVAQAINVIFGGNPIRLQ